MISTRRLVSDITDLKMHDLTSAVSIKMLSIFMTSKKCLTYFIYGNCTFSLLMTKRFLPPKDSNIYRAYHITVEVIPAVKNFVKQ